MCVNAFYKTCEFKCYERVMKVQHYKHQRKILSIIITSRYRKIMFRYCAGDVEALPEGSVLARLLAGQLLAMGGVGAVYPVYKQLNDSLDNDLR